MIGAVLNEEGIVINRIVVDSLSDISGLVDGENCSIGDKWDGGKFVRTTMEQVVPQSIPSLNGRIVMIQAGWMPAVRSVLDAMEDIEGEIAREYFNNSLTYERNHPLVLSIPTAIGKTQDEVDALFIQAGAMHV